MKTASTLDFRRAVRLVTAQMGGTVLHSWTEPPGRVHSQSKRYVSFSLYGVNSQTVATAAEKLLNTLGMTAGTRCQSRDSAANYVRGTCTCE